MWEQQLINGTPGKVMTFTCSSVTDTFSTIDLSGTSTMESLKMVAYKWHHLPALTVIIDDILSALAKVAQALWPYWYALKEGFSMPGNRNLLEKTVADYLKVHKLAETHKGISAVWLKAAISCCHNDKIPLPDGFPNAVLAEQLAMTIEPQNLLILLGVEEQQPAKDKLFGLARSAEWLAKETRSRVAVLIPQNLGQAQELESILYGATDLVKDENNFIQAEVDETEKYLFGPVRGTPHPFSPGEQKLARHLQTDPELTDLFQFNRSIKTIRENRYLVDLVWESGKLVVEVDGYAYHSNRTAFKLDRQRDYELSISGYTVLRLPHDEVMRDVTLAMEKIRDMVRLFQKGRVKPE